MDPSYVYCAVSFYTGGCYLLFYRVILGTWGARRNAGGSVTYQLIISERNIWFASPLSDNTVLGIDVVKCTRSKLVPAINAAGISVVLYGAYFSDNKYFLKALSEIGITPF